MTIAGILNKKGTRVLTVLRTTPVLEAVDRMKREKIGALVVSDNGRDIQGIVSERDVLHALASNGAGLLTMKVEDIMTRRVESCVPQDNVKRVMSIMTQHRCRHMPVVDDDGLCGMISIGDIVKQRLEEAELETSVAREALIFSR
jgi:CBS domain-containing protein